MRRDRPQMDTRTLLRERLRRSRDWAVAIDELEKELEAVRSVLTTMGVGGAPGGSG